MKIMISGDKGFVGTETTKHLIEKGHQIIGYDIMDKWDIRDGNQVEQFVSRETPDRILHLAAIARFSDADKNPRLAHETNVLGTLNVARVAQRFHIPLAYASTGSVYMPVVREPPITEEFEAKGNSVYGCTKYMGELYVREYANPFIILRYAHLYGKEKRHHGLVGGFYERIKRGLAPTLYGGNQSNDFTYIRDVARANCLALETSWDNWNEVYNIGTGQELTAEDAGRIICELTGWKEGIERKESRTVDPPRFVYDVSKATNKLSFTAEYEFSSGLKDMIDEEKTETLSKLLGDGKTR